MVGLEQLKYKFACNFKHDSQESNVKQLMFKSACHFKHNNLVGNVEQLKSACHFKHDSPIGCAGTVQIESTLYYYFSFGLQV